MMPATLILKNGREKSLIRRHPWIFSGAIANVQGNPEPGDTIAVRSTVGDFLAWAAYSPHSQIRARAWSFEEQDRIDANFFRNKLNEAFAARNLLPDLLPKAEDMTDGKALRLVHAESDGLPGFILDRYGNTLVAQILSAGPERWRDTLADLVMEQIEASCLYERSDVDARLLEGLPERTGLLRGSAPPERIPIDENGLKFWVNIVEGHKTGFYLDQRINRARVRRLSGRREVLDCFCYTGGFSANALAGGATSVLSIDSSADALAVLGENLALNGLPTDRSMTQEEDVFRALRMLRDSRRSFDMVILDPPKFAQTAAQAERAARGYKDINLLAIKLLRPGGLLITFSCSGGVSPELFQKIVAGAAVDAGRDAQFLERLYQAPDHPVRLSFPEGLYLKGFVIRVV